MTPTPSAQELAEIETRRADIRERHLRPPDERPASSARGLHHTALISRDVERTIRFYQEVLEFPLTELIENRDYPGSSHFFFDIGNGNLLAFFDFPGLDVGPYAEVLGGLHHIAISVEPEQWRRLKGVMNEDPSRATTRIGVRACLADALSEVDRAQAPDDLRVQADALLLGQAVRWSMTGPRAVGVHARLRSAPRGEGACGPLRASAAERA